mmetsp:Transcript_46038/g.68559  ORF Transcript_46038/g.68559 Transcript_46038/m.68559 type:complete len:230 (-) Transcript_46038:270-959(-)
MPEIFEWFSGEDINFIPWTAERDGDFTLAFFLVCFDESDGIGVIDASTVVSHDDPHVEFRKLLVRIIIAARSAQSEAVIVTAPPSYIPIQFMRPLRGLDNNEEALPMMQITYSFSQSLHQAKSFLKMEPNVVEVPTTRSAYHIFVRHLEKAGSTKEDMFDVFSSLGVWTGYLVPTRSVPLQEESLITIIQGFMAIIIILGFCGCVVKLLWTLSSRPRRHYRRGRINRLR